jgi:transcriptional regulator with XRE-family HTH domain
MKTVLAWLEDRGMNLDQLVATSGLDSKRVKAIASGNYTASPSDRKRLAAALGVPIEEISWDHSIAVQHLRGNGPQSGRST